MANLSLSQKQKSVERILDRIRDKKFQLWQEAVRDAAILKKDYIAAVSLSARYTALCQAQTRAIAFLDYLVVGEPSRYYWFSAMNYRVPFREILPL